MHKEENTEENINEVNNASLKKEKKKNKLFETFETVFVALILAIFIRATVAEARYIPSESMVPTLLVQDRLVVEKISNYTGKPHRGDILVFYPPINDNEPDTVLNRSLTWLGITSKNAYIKRVVGLPGETVEVKDGSVYIDGKALDESAYIKEKPNYTMDKVKLKDDELFMCGDNRNNSLDSHIWGPLPEKNIIGHAILRFWPINRIGTVK